MNNLIEHHTKYIETHGVDETVWMTRSEHHRKDHRTLFPGFTIQELAKITRAANARTKKCMVVTKKYTKNNIRKKSFVLRIENVYVDQIILCNKATGNITFNSHFKPITSKG